MGNIPHPSLWGMELTAVQHLHESDLQTRTHVHGDLKVHTTKSETDISPPDGGQYTVHADDTIPHLI